MWIGLFYCLFLVLVSGFFLCGWLSILGFWLLGLNFFLWLFGMIGVMLVWGFMFCLVDCFCFFWMVLDCWSFCGLLCGMLCMCMIFCMYVWFWFCDWVGCCRYFCWVLCWLLCYLGIVWCEVVLLVEVCLFC